jgi:hypothetical protein
MQIYKTRSFGDFFTDTIEFFRHTGKHFYKNFILINGGFILIVALLLYFLTKLYMDSIFSSITNPAWGVQPSILDYFADNAVLFITLVSALLLLSLFLSILNITYPIIYLQLYDKHGNNGFEAADIVVELKQNLGKMLRFMVGFLFVLLPIILVIAGILILLMFILIGIPLMLITIPAVIAWISLSYHQYILGSSGFLGSLGIGFTMLRHKFWTITGVTALWALIIQMLQGAVTFIPYIVGFGAIIAGVDPNQPETDSFSSIAIFMAAMMVFGIVVSYILNNIIIVAQGMIYFSIKEQSEHRSATSTIDEIGSEY